MMATSMRAPAPTKLSDEIRKRANEIVCGDDAGGDRKLKNPCTTSNSFFLDIFSSREFLQGEGSTDEELDMFRQDDILMVSNCENHVEQGEEVMQEDGEQGSSRRSSESLEIERQLGNHYLSLSLTGGEMESPSHGPRTPSPAHKDVQKSQLFSGKLPAFMDVRHFVGAYEELPQGARMTLFTVIMSWRSGKLSADNVESFCRSVAWQSASLRMALVAPKESAIHVQEELLTVGDVEELLSRVSSGSTTKTMSPISSPGISPSNRFPKISAMVCSRDGEEQHIKAAIEALGNSGLMDSSRTQRLTGALRGCPKLEQVFMANGWDPVLQNFTDIPDWKRAQAELALLVDSGIL